MHRKYTLEKIYIQRKHTAKVELFKQHEIALFEIKGVLQKESQT